MRVSCKILVLIITIVATYNLHAQVQKTDSLIKLLNKTEIDSSKIRILIDLCKTLRLSGTPNSKYVMELEILAKKEKNDRLKAEAYRALGNCYDETNLSKATINYEIALKIFKSIAGDPGVWGYAVTQYNYGTVFHYNGDFGSAIKMYLESERAFLKYNDLKNLIGLYIKLGDAYDKLEKPDRRNFYNQKAIELALKSKDEKLLGKAYMTQAITLIYEDKYKEAELYIGKTLDIAIKTDDKMQQHIAFYNLGMMYSRQDNFETSLNYYLKAYKIAKDIGATNDACDALYKIGMEQYYLERFNVARKTLFEALLIADTLKSNILKRNIYDVLSCLEAEAGNYKKSNEYLNSYIELIYEIFSEESQKQVNFLDAKYQAQKREGEIKRLEDEKQIKDLQLSKRKQWIFGLFSIISILLILTVFIHLNYRNKKARAQQEITLKEQQIAHLQKQQQLLATQSVLQGEEAERGRLARDLHDGLGGLLSGIKLSLSGMKGNVVLTSESVELYNKTLSMLDNSIHELRRVAHNMMPEALTKFGLKSALSDFCSSIDNSKSIELNFQHYGEDKRLENKIEISVYRIAQELINNAIKYSRCNNLLVQIVQDPGRIHLTVQDDGIGFNTAILATSKGSGIANIKSRVESLNGRLDIFAEPDKGTEISVEFHV